MNNRALPLQTVHRQKLSDEIVRQLENLIVNNELNVGDALPPERELAAQLGVSRNILREAISTMVQKGLLEVRQGSGTYVASPSIELLRDSLSFFVRFSASGLYDLLEARFALEVQIADLAARRSTPEDVSRIAACYEDLKGAVDDPDRYIEADIRFHAALARAAKNEILLLLLDSIRGAMRENVRVLVTRHPHAVEDAMYFHQRINQAIQQGSAVEAREGMRMHLESVRLGLHELESFEKDPEKQDAA
jgi:GntR family transcriptional repressor for pyruvate dehydrogenase complex